MKLIPIDGNDPQARAEIVAFVNRHYPSELPLEEAPLAAGLIQFFWAFDDDGARVGCSAYMRKTKYLAEAVKTVVDPAYRRRGTGAAISLAMEEEVRRRGFTAISLAMEEEVRRRGFTKLMSTILIGNLPMLFIKLRQGFIVEGIHMDHEKPGLHEYSLGKVLK